MHELMSKIAFFSLIVGLAMCLSSCEDSERLQTLKIYVSSLKNRVHDGDPKEKIKAYQLPKPVIFLSSEAGSENAENIGVANQNVNPLIAYPLKSYKFIGTLSSGDQITGFVLAPNHMTYPIKENDVIGNLSGKVKKIDNDHMEIVEKDSAVSKQGGEKIVIIKLKD